MLAESTFPDGLDPNKTILSNLSKPNFAKIQTDIVFGQSCDEKGSLGLTTHKTGQLRDLRKQNEGESILSSPQVSFADIVGSGKNSQSLKLSNGCFERDSMGPSKSSKITKNSQKHSSAKRRGLEVNFFADLKEDFNSPARKCIQPSFASPKGDSRSPIRVAIDTVYETSKKVVNGAGQLAKKVANKIISSTTFKPRPNSKKNLDVIQEESNFETEYKIISDKSSQYFQDKCIGMGQSTARRFGIPQQRDSQFANDEPRDQDKPIVKNSQVTGELLSQGSNPFGPRSNLPSQNKNDVTACFGKSSNLPSPSDHNATAVFGIPESLSKRSQ
jgi:hypothetical protein